MDADRIDIPDRMSEACEALEWLADAARKLPGEPDEDRAQMIVVLTLARGYIAGYAAHRAAGRSEVEAIEAAAQGQFDHTGNGERHEGPH